MAASDSSTDLRSDRDAKVEEANIFNSFAALIRSQFSEQTNVDRLDKLYQHPDYGGEKALLTRMNNNGMFAGIATGIGTFIFLRRGPRVISRYMLRSAQQRAQGGGSRGGYRFEAMQRTNPFEPANAAAGGGAEQIPPRKPGILIRAFKLGLDLFVSTTLALYASAIFTDKCKLLNDASEIPLVEGRSMISDELCADFMKHYSTIPQSTWEKYRGGRSDALGAIEAFVVNCKRREMCERMVREERGLKPGGTAEHVSIPSPGVPRDLDVVLGEIGKETKSTDDEEEGEEDREKMNETSFESEYFGVDAEQPDEGGVVNEDGSLGEWTSIDDFEKDRDSKFGSADSGKRSSWGW